MPREKYKTTVLIDGQLLEEAKRLGFQNISFHLNQWLKNWITFQHQLREIPAGPDNYRKKIVGGA